MNRMLLTALGFVLLLGCSTPQQLEQQRQHSLGIATSTLSAGVQAAQNMTRRYNDTRWSCNDVEEMAFKCTGILFRGSVASPDFHAWNPAPTAYLRNGVSFSFLRADAKFTKLAYNYNHGFVVFPENDRPVGKTTIEVRCAFPMDAGTEQRPNDACGQVANLPESRPCQEQGVRTAEQWIALFAQQGSQPFNQCGFKVHEASGAASADAFAQTIKAMGLLGATSFNMQNELILTPWAQDIGHTLPIEAFFYTPEGTGGLAGAREDQQDFYNVTSTLLPVIRMTLPTVVTANATFEYRSEDQWIPGAQTITSVKGQPSNADIPEGGSTVETSVILSGAASTGQEIELFDGATSKGRFTATDGIWTSTAITVAVGARSFTAKALYGTEPVSDARTFTVSPALVIDPSQVNLHATHHRSHVTPSHPPGGAYVDRQPSAGTPPYTYSSSNPDIAEVNADNGRVISKGTGTATITVRDQSGLTGSYTVNCANIRWFFGYTRGNYVSSNQWAQSQGGTLPSEAEYASLRNNYGGNGLNADIGRADLNRNWIPDPGGAPLGKKYVIDPRDGRKFLITDWGSGGLSENADGYGVRGK